MLDSILPDRLLPAPGGLRAVLGPLVLQIQSPERDAAALLGEEQAVVWTILEIEGERQARPILMGFSSAERREMYEAMRGLSGIGRRSGLLLLDNGETLDILRAVAGADSDFFAAVPGIGQKRIQAVIEHLHQLHDGALPKPLPLPVREWVDARDSLVSSGKYTADEAEQLLRKGDGQTAEELLRSVQEI